MPDLPMPCMNSEESGISLSIHVNTLNDLIKDSVKFINECERDYLKKATDAAKAIARNMSNCPIVLLSGPSGSGKTTTAKTIENILDSKGFEAHTLSMDNYFHTLSNSEIAAANEGRLDLESPSRLDISLLNDHIEKMINCMEVELPCYNFELSKQLPSGITLKRKQGEIIIFEGIHALNPSVITADHGEAEKIYVSVRTRVEHNGVILHPSKIRLLRRMIRDRLYRGRTILQTVERFCDVEQGEQKYIMPYKKYSNHDIDTFIPYELSVYKDILKNELEALKHINELSDILEIFKGINSLGTENIGPDALIKEFIG